MKATMKIFLLLGPIVIAFFIAFPPTNNNIIQHTGACVCMVVQQQSIDSLLTRTCCVVGDVIIDSSYVSKVRIRGIKEPNITYSLEYGKAIQYLNKNFRECEIDYFVKTELKY